MLTKTLETGP